MNPSKLTILREEAKRKTIHICGVAIPVLYFFLPKHLVVLGFVFSFFAIFVLEWLRFRGVISLPFLRQSEKEKKKIGAYVFFVIGAFISILIFEKSIAIASILMLAIGDSASALAGAVKSEDNSGMYEKRIKPPEVMLVMFAVSFIIGYLVLHSLPVAAFGAVIADGMPLKVYGVTIDDNLTIPLFSGILMMSFWWVFSGF